jgi:hypothetical protein
MMTAAVVAGALAIVMTSVSFTMDRAPNEPTSSAFTLDLNRLMYWAVVVIPIILLLRFWKSPAKRSIENQSWHGQSGAERPPRGIGRLWFGEHSYS